MSIKRPVIIPAILALGAAGSIFAGSAVPTALELAGQWTQSPPAYLSAAAKSLEPQLCREHELRKEELRQAALRESHSYVLSIMGIVAGFAIALAAIIMAKRDPDLAGMLAGPGLANVMAIIVLNRSRRTAAQRPQSGDPGSAPAPVRRMDRGRSGARNRDGREVPCHVD